jgi:orotidine-5'-phosphate decarboxylase
MATAPTLIQIALDFPTIDQAIACARLGVEAGVDILEVGTPLIVAQGANTIGQLKRRFLIIRFWRITRRWTRGARTLSSRTRRAGNI